MQLEIVDPLAFLQLFLPFTKWFQRRVKKCVPKRDCILIATSLGLLIFLLGPQSHSFHDERVSEILFYKISMYLLNFNGT